MNPRRLIAVLLTVSLATACTTPGRQLPATSAPTGTAVSVPPDEDDADGVGTAPSAPPAGTAVVAAVTYIQAWARPGLTHVQWENGIRALVTPAYEKLLADTDPANVTAHIVTGAPRPVSSTTDVVVVDVPTDAGLIRVTLITARGRWLVATATPAGTP